MAIVDPFDTPTTSKGIVDPFETAPKDEGSAFARAVVPSYAMAGRPVEQTKPGEGFDWSQLYKSFGSETAKAAEQAYGGLFDERGIPKPGASLPAAAGIVFSPLTGLVHGPLAQMLAGGERAAGEYIVNPLLRAGGVPEQRLQHPAQRVMAEQAGRDIDKAQAAAMAGRDPAAAAAILGEPERVARIMPPEPPERRPYVSPMQQAVGQIEEATGQRPAIPRAIGSESPTVQSFGQGVSKFPIVGMPVGRAVGAVPEELGAGLPKIAEAYGMPTTPANVGSDIRETLSEAARTERQAAEARAAAERQAAEESAARQESAIQAAHQQASEQRIARIEAGPQQSAQVARRTFGDVEPIEMAEDTANNVQAAHQQAEQAKIAAYDRMNQLDAGISQRAFPELRGSAEDALTHAGFTIENPGTNASAMMREIEALAGRPGQMPAGVPDRVMRSLRATYGDNIPAEAFEALGHPGATEAVPPNFRLAGRFAPAPGAPDIPIQGLEELSKRIRGMARNAVEPQDRAASNIIRNAFENWRENALGNHLMPGGDPNAGTIIDAARGANRDWMNRFGYNATNLPAGERRNAGRILNQIVTGDIGPENLARQLVGANPGTRPVSHELFNAISGAVADPNAFRNSVRGAYWNRLDNSRNTAGAIEDLLPTRMGRQLFEPHEQDFLRAHGGLTESTPEAIRQAQQEAKLTKPKPARLEHPELEPGEAEQLAKRVLGQGRGNEQVFAHLDKMAQAKGGDIETLGKLWRAIPPEQRGSAASAVIHQMGGGGAEFSPGKFVSKYDSYSPQARAIMFGFEGPQQAALKATRDIAQQYIDVHKKFGNISGTTITGNWAGLAKALFKSVANIKGALAGGAAIASPLGTLSLAAGGLGVSRLLASPIAAPQVMRWMKIADVAARYPRAQTIAELRSATSSLARTASRLGIDINDLTK
jgi:hypothetical protein